MNLHAWKIQNTGICANVAVSMSHRIRTRLRGRDREKLKREPNLRLEERLRERNRIARELHDTLFQGLFGASLLLHNAADELPADSPGKVSVDLAVRAIEHVLDDARTALQGLRSDAPGTTNLEQALGALREEFVPAAGVTFRVLVSGRPQPLDPAIQQQIYMIGREAVVNALRHSQATKIDAEIEYLSRRVRLLVRDDGCGINPQILRSGRDSHWGLLGMRERSAEIGATLRIRSTPGAGTVVEVCVSADSPGAETGEGCRPSHEG